jgi:hypothetical protein
MKRILFPSLWDWKSIILSGLVLLVCPIIFAQQEQLIIRATSNKADIKDGDIYQKAIWNLSPEAKPDIYYALAPVVPKKITFYTDIDSISFNIVPGARYSFIILLNNRDSCYTQIATSRPVNEVEANTVLVNPINTELLKQDFSIFREALQKEHAGLYRYKSKKSLDKLFDSCFSALNHPMRQLDFAKLIMFMISSIEDGHTGTNFSRLLLNYYSKNEKLFPISVFFITKRAYVLCSKIKELPTGSEILSIDTEPVSGIREKLLHYLPSDGKIETKKMQTLNNGAFSFLYAWIFGHKNSFYVRYKTKQGEIKRISINAELVKDFDCDNRGGSNKRDLELDFPQQNTALLTIKTFDDNRLGGRENFQDFLDRSFTELNDKRMDNLVIDLRGTAGGRDEYGALLYSYLANGPFKYFFSIESTKGQVRINENSLLGLQQPNKKRFNGRVFFLINGLCFSTTSDFCAIAKSNNRGIFIGEETGGAYYGNTSGKIVRAPLPNSQIILTIPTYKYVNDVKKAKHKDRGILPDYTIVPTINEIIEHKDVQLEASLKLIKMKMK